MPVRDLRFAGQKPNNAPMEKMPGFDAFEYSLAVKNKGRPPEYLAVGDLRCGQEQAGAAI